MTTAPQPAGAVLLAGMPPPAHDDLMERMPAASGLLNGMPTAGQAQPGLLDRLTGIGERGMVGGVDGLVNTAQAAGRWADNHLGNNDFLDRLDNKIDNFPVAKNLDQALEADHPYAPQDAFGKILQGAMSGVTGGVLSGGLDAVPALTGAAVGAAVPTARAMGASDATADDLGVGLSLLPLAGAGVNAARGLAGSAARTVAASRAASNMTDEQAVHTVLMNDAIGQYQGAASGPVSSFQAAGAYKKDLAGIASQYARSGRQAGIIDRDTATDLSTATSQANAHTNSLSDAPGSAFDQLQQPGVLPAAHAPVVNTLLRQLDATSPQQFKNASAGPFATAAGAVAPYVGWGSALGSMLGGHFGPLVDAAAGGTVGKVAGAILPAAGRAADHLLGTAVTPAEANYAGALKRVQQNDLTVPSSPLTDGRALVADNQQLASDNATASTMSNEADKQYLYQHADAQAMNRQFDMTQRQQRAYEVGDATAMDRQITSQQNFERAQQVGDATAIDRQRTAGQTAADSAGNWMERQSRLKFQAANPDVPVTGAAVLSARTPDQVFAATGGKYGSPVPPGTPDGTPNFGPAAQTPSTSAGAPAASAAPPVPSAAPPAPPAAPAMGPFNPNAAPSGGAALASMMHQDMTGRAPTTAQLHQSANAVLDPQTAFEFTSGASTSRNTAYQVAQHAAQAVPQQASADVASAMGQPVPNGGSRGPILNQSRWQGAANNYQRHATQMGQLAPTAAESAYSGDGDQPIRSIVITCTGDRNHAVHHARGVHGGGLCGAFWHHH